MARGQVLQGEDTRTGPSARPKETTAQAADWSGAAIPVYLPEKFILSCSGWKRKRGYGREESAGLLEHWLVEGGEAGMSSGKWEQLACHLRHQGLPYRT